MSLIVEIPLSKRGKNRGKYITIVDDIDRDLAELNISVICKTNINYAHYNRIRLHRIILGRMLDRELTKDEFVDHINGNGLDNRRENLRLATAGQNKQNSRTPKNNTTGYKGVYTVKGRKGYCSSIMVNRKSIYLGYFKTAEDAYQARCEATKLYHGEFARLD